MKPGWLIRIGLVGSLMPRSWSLSYVIATGGWDSRRSFSWPWSALSWSTHLSRRQRNVKGRVVRDNMALQRTIALPRCARAGARR
jgi:hypothetical protein